MLAEVSTGPFDMHWAQTVGVSLEQLMLDIRGSEKTAQYSPLGGWDVLYHLGDSKYFRVGEHESKLGKDTIIYRYDPQMKFLERFDVEAWMATL